MATQEIIILRGNVFRLPTQTEIKKSRRHIRGNLMIYTDQHILL